LLRTCYGETGVIYFSLDTIPRNTSTTVSHFQSLPPVQGVMGCWHRYLDGLIISHGVLVSLAPDSQGLITGDVRQNFVRKIVCPGLTLDSEQPLLRPTL